MKILIADDVHPIMAQTWISLGHDVVVIPDLSQEDLLKHIHLYEGLVVSTKNPVNRQVIDLGYALKFVARVGSGMEHIDQHYAANKDIVVVSSPEGNARAVGEHALAMLLALVRHLTTAHQQILHHQWIREANRGMELANRVIGIIGYGHTGPAFVDILAGLGMKVLVHDKYVDRDLPPYATWVTKDYIQEHAEIISLHLPYTTETHYYINEDFLAACNRPLILLNTSRGKIVDTKVLVKYLKLGKVLAAGLDVLENENLQKLTPEELSLLNELKEMPEKVLLTPHIAGWTFESKQRLATVIIEKLRHLTG